MKKRLIQIAGPVIATMIGLSPVLSSAQTQDVPQAPITDVRGVFDFLCGIFGLFFTLFIIASIILVLWAAFKYLTAGGDPEKVKSANHSLIYAAVAVVVALLSRGFPFIINSLFSGGGGGGGLTSACS
ncbi:MAG: hypothetical protein AAB652_00175 [Patescibacteria group bacterium]